MFCITLYIYMLILSSEFQWLHLHLFSCRDVKHLLVSLCLCQFFIYWIQSAAAKIKTDKELQQCQYCHYSFNIWYIMNSVQVSCYVGDSPMSSKSLTSCRNNKTCPSHMYLRKWTMTENRRKEGLGGKIWKEKLEKLYVHVDIDG